MMFGLFLLVLTGVKWHQTNTFLQQDCKGIFLWQSHIHSQLLMLSYPTSSINWVSKKLLYDTRSQFLLFYFFLLQRFFLQWLYKLCWLFKILQLILSSLLIYSSPMETMSHLVLMRCLKAILFEYLILYYA